MTFKYLFTLTFLFSTQLLFSQTISRSNLATAGDVVTNSSGITISWSIGEVFSNTVQNDNHITGGFQQGILIKKNKVAEEKSIPLFPEQEVNTTTNTTNLDFQKQILLFYQPLISQLSSQYQSALDL